MNVQAHQHLKIRLLATVSLTALGFFHPSFAGAEGFKTCTEMLAGTSCESMSQDIPLFKMCCHRGNSDSVPRLPPQGGENLSAPMSCYSAIRTRSWGEADYKISSDGIHEAVLLPATVDGRKGFYYFTPKTVYFQAFPQEKSKLPQFSTYLYKIQTPGQPPVYLTYKDDPSAPTNPLLTVAPNPTVETKDQFVNFSSNDALNPSSRQALSRELQKRVKTVTETYTQEMKRLNEAIERDRQFGRSNNPDLQADLETQKKLKSSFQDALSSCALKDDPALTATVAAEREKLARVSPAISGSGSTPADSTGTGAAGVH